MQENFKMAKIGTDILEAARLLRSGETVAVPTETVYGLAANALDEAAVLKIFKAKNRPTFDPLIVHSASLDHAKPYIKFIPDQAKILAEAIWPGPLTLLLEKKGIPDLVTSGLPKVGIRVPNHPLTLSLLGMLDFPLAAPSANPFGYVSPTTAEHVQVQLGTRIPYILDGGASTIGLESTIVGFEDGKPTIYRLGGKKTEEIERLIGPVQLKLNTSSNPTAPGMLKTHYAPSVQLRIGDIPQLLSENKGKRVGVISFQLRYDHPRPDQQILSPSGDLDEAARHLFGALRQMDSRGYELIITEKFPDTGLGKAINDRLTRASIR